MVRRYFSFFSILSFAFIGSLGISAEVGGEVSAALLQNLRESTVLLHGQKLGKCSGVIIWQNVILGTARCAAAQQVIFSDGRTAVIDFSVTHPEFRTLTGQSLEDLAYQSDAIDDLALFHFTGSSPNGTGWMLEDVEYFPVSTNDGKAFSYFYSWGSGLPFFNTGNSQKVITYRPLEQTSEVTSWGISGAPIFGVNREGTKGGLLGVTVRPAFSRKPSGAKAITSVALIGSPIVLYQNWISEWVQAFLLFDEGYYLRKYADVATQVKSGRMKSGLHHYFTMGEKQDLSPSAAVDLESYKYQLSQKLRAFPGGRAQYLSNVGLTLFRHWLLIGPDEEIQ